MRAFGICLGIAAIMMGRTAPASAQPGFDSVEGVADSSVPMRSMTSCGSPLSSPPSAVTTSASRTLRTVQSAVVRLRAGVAP